MGRDTSQLLPTGMSEALCLVCWRQDVALKRKVELP